jgi:hypothetical protein
MSSGTADAISLGDQAKALSILAVAENGLPIQFQGTASDLAALEARPPHAGPDPFDDQVAFEFGDHP